MEMEVFSKDFEVIDKLAELADIAREDVVHDLLHFHTENFCREHDMREVTYEELRKEIESAKDLCV